jgi:hypothetical protein
MGASAMTPSKLGTNPNALCALFRASRASGKRSLVCKRRISCKYSPWGTHDSAYLRVWCDRALGHFSVAYVALSRSIAPTYARTRGIVIASLRIAVAGGAWVVLMQI